MRVCLLTNYYPPFNLGGVAEVTYNIKKHLEEAGHDVYVITRGKFKEGEPNVARLGCAYSLGNYTFIIKSFIHLFKLLFIEKRKFDVIHIQALGGLGLLPLVPYIRKSGTKIILTCHTSPVGEIKSIAPLKIDGKIIANPKFSEIVPKYTFYIFHHIETLLLTSIADKITAVSKRTASELMKDYNIPNKKIKVIYNGIDFRLFNQKTNGDAIREKFNLQNYKVLLFVGRFHIRKGVHYLLFAFRNIAKEYPDVKLLLIGGTGDHKQELIKTINDFDINRQTIFLGKINSSLSEYYAAADIVIVPSTYEGFPLVVLEAMASSKIVIASNVGGVEEIIKDGENGFIFTSGDVTELTEKIRATIENKNPTIIKNIRQTIKDFDWKQITEEYLSLYRGLENL